MYYFNTYDRSEIKLTKDQISQIDLHSKYQILIDLEDPSTEELNQIQEKFLIDANILNQYSTENGNYKYIILNYI
jgi:Mg2+ and Co2+ transporter CorA